MLKGFIAGVLISNAFEWVAHKYILHGVHRKGQPRFSPSPASMNSHWTHHRLVRKQQFNDEGYVEGLKNERTRLELLSLVVVASTASTLAYPFSKGMALSFWYCAGKYFYVHRRAHLEPDWAKNRIPWHYDHHMNSNQDANWCVTRPWFDYVMGTRVASTNELMESNLLGMRLPLFIEKLFNAWSRKKLPGVFATLEKNLQLEQKAQKALEQDSKVTQQVEPAA
ncbi:hypothetical protein ACF3NA_00550 [Alkanindiges sp. WGS2144]|uniref:hypothetical protein n=1 Tax=Alkanindiges sp. WGS2144 TaxID=3366808 RepID=UPI003751A725